MVEGNGSVGGCAECCAGRSLRIYDKGRIEVLEDTVLEDVVKALSRHFLGMYFEGNLDSGVMY